MKEVKPHYPQFFKYAVIAGLFSKWFGLTEKVVENNSNKDNSLVDL